MVREVFTTPIQTSQSSSGHSSPVKSPKMRNCVSSTQNKQIEDAYERGGAEDMHRVAQRLRVRPNTARDIVRRAKIAKRNAAIHDVARDRDRVNDETSTEAGKPKMGRRPKFQDWIKLVIDRPLEIRKFQNFSNLSRIRKFFLRFGNRIRKSRNFSKYN